eukprot:scaffold202527_cov15-Tisochrysis_lutea.AAC.1
MAGPCTGIPARKGKCACMQRALFSTYEHFRLNGWVYPATTVIGNILLAFSFRVLSGQQLQAVRAATGVPQ